MAKVIEVPAANLAASVNRFNELVTQGEDKDFEVPKSGLTNRIETLPFYAMSKTYRCAILTAGFELTEKPK